MFFTKMLNILTDAKDNFHMDDYYVLSEGHSLVP